VKTSTVDRERRINEINSELGQLETLQERVRTLVPQPMPALAGRE
jgi:hypothetical protein